MAKKNNFSEKVKNKWTFDQWKAFVPDDQYKLITRDEIPDFILNTSMSGKLHSALVASSGNDKAHYFVTICYRPDGGNTILDQEPYVVLFDKTKAGAAEPKLSGFIHHAKFSGSRQPLDKNVTHLLSLCGVTANIKCVSVPQKATGTLQDLQNEGLLTGTEFTVDVAGKKAEKAKK